jgi:peptidoglycan/xylan/chitin deacetylase (PgdA/CDA1 family)
MNLGLPIKGFLATTLAIWAAWATANHWSDAGLINSLALAVAMGMGVWALAYLIFTKLGVTATMIRRVLVVLAVIALPSSIWLTSLVEAAPANIIPNASLETSANGDSGTPQGWERGVWGTNTASFTYPSVGAQDGTRDVRVEFTGYKNGDAKWFFTPVQVAGGSQLVFTDYYKASVANYVIARFEDGTGNYSYLQLAAPTASTGWKQVQAKLTVPKSAVKMTVFHLIKSKGWVETDNFRLTGATAATPSPTPSATSTPKPSVSLSATPSPSPSISPSASPTPSSTPTPTPSATAIPTPSVIPTPSATPTPTPSPAPYDPGLIANGSAETLAAGLPDSWQTAKWGTNLTAFEYKSSGHNSNHSLSINQSGYTDGDAKWAFTPVPVQAGQSYRFSDWYESNVTTSVVVKLNMADGSTVYKDLGAPATSTDWKQFSATFTAPAGVQSVTIYHIIAANGYLTTDDYSLAIAVQQPFARGLVSLTFDDGWLDQYTYGLPLLQKYHVPGTFYLISDALQWPGYMRVAEIMALQAAGNELGSHTVSHSDLTTLTQIELTNELLGSQTTLRGLFGGQFSTLASPYGSYNDLVLTEIQKYYQSHRTTDLGYNSRDNLNPYEIKVQNVYASTPESAVDAWIAKAAADHLWLVLVYHQVDPDPAAATIYGVSPTQLENQLQAIQTSGLTPVTISSALGELLPQLGQ